MQMLTALLTVVGSNVLTATSGVSDKQPCSTARPQQATDNGKCYESVRQS